MPMTQSERVDKLAEYFTGPAVAISSVGLEMGGDRAMAANAFFAARNALDVSGYMSKAEAKLAIAAALGVNL